MHAEPYNPTDVIHEIRRRGQSYYKVISAEPSGTVMQSAPGAVYAGEVESRAALRTCPYNRVYKLPEGTLVMRARCPVDEWRTTLKPLTRGQRIKHRLLHAFNRDCAVWIDDLTQQMYCKGCGAEVR